MATPYTFKNPGPPRILPALTTTENVPDDALGGSIANPRWATVVGPGKPGSGLQPVLEMVRPRLVSDFLLSNQDYSDFKRNKRSAAALRSLAKGIVLHNSNAVFSKADPLYIEMIYQVAASTNPPVAQWMRQEKQMLMEMFGVAPMPTALGAASRVVNHDPDCEVEHFPEFVKRQKWLAKTGLGSAQAIAAAKRARSRQRWMITAKTAVTLTQRANDMRAAGGRTLAGMPQVGVFELRKNKGPGKRFRP